MAPTINPAHQAFILTRLGEFCQFTAKIRRYEDDPWAYMRAKLLQLEPPIAALKEELFVATRQRLLAEMRAGGVDEERFSDYKQLLERLLSRGDFADAAIHLTAQARPGSAEAIESLLAQARIDHVFIQERLAAAERSPAWEKLVAELYGRLGLNELGTLLARRKTTRRRRAAALRLMRRNVAEYCSVMRIPTQADQTFTPFMLPRLEALIGACLRFLNSHR